MNREEYNYRLIAEQYQIYKHEYSSGSVIIENLNDRKALILYSKCIAIELKQILDRLYNNSYSNKELQEDYNSYKKLKIDCYTFQDDFNGKQAVAATTQFRIGYKLYNKTKISKLRVYIDLVDFSWHGDKKVYAFIGNEKLRRNSKRQIVGLFKSIWEADKFVNKYYWNEYFYKLSIKKDEDTKKFIKWYKEKYE